MVDIAEHYLAQRRDYLITEMRNMYGADVAINNETLGSFESFYDYLAITEVPEIKPRLQLVTDEIADRL